MGDRAREAKDQAKEKLSGATAEARGRGSDLVEEGKDKAQELGERAGEMARSQGDQQRERVAEGVRTFADALRRGNQDLPDDRREYGRFIDDVANRVEGVSRYLEEHDVDTLTREARRFARDQTPLFLSGAFTLGMLGARFLKSSGEDAGEVRPASDRYGRDRDSSARHALEPRRTQRWSAPTDPTESYEREGMYPRPAQDSEEGGYA